MGKTFAEGMFFPALMPYSNSVLIVDRSDVGTLRERITHPDIIGNGEAFIRMVENWLFVHTSMGETEIQLSYDDLSTLQNWIDRSIQ